MSRRPSRLVSECGSCAPGSAVPNCSQTCLDRHSSPGRTGVCAYAGGGELGVLGATAAERRDEAALARGERPAGKARDVQTAFDLRLPGEAKARKLSSLDLLCDRIPREEGDPEPFAGGPLDRLARVQLPHPRRRGAELREHAISDLTCARAGLANEQGLPGDGGRLDPTVADQKRARLGDADDLVGEEWRQLDSIVDLSLADESKLDTPS